MNVSDARLIFLSPHLDDVVWSCGGYIASQTRQGRRVLVMTVCAGDPPAQLPESALIRELQAGGEATMAGRRAEDLAALQVLQAEALHLPVSDAVYRFNARTGRALYPTMDALFGPLHQQDETLIEQVVGWLRQLEPLEGALVFAPLAVGHHVDHQLVRVAAERWGAPGGQMVYYEDFPYAESEWAVQAALFENDIELERQALPLEPIDVERKVQASACYTSQVKMFFNDADEMEKRMRVYMQTTERIYTKDMKGAKDTKG